MRSTDNLYILLSAAKPNEPNISNTTRRRKKNSYNVNTIATSTGSDSSIDDIVDNVYRIRSTYTNNFTIHGLAKVLYGLLWEKFLWIIVLGSCLGTVSYFSYGFYTDYVQYDIYTEFRLKSSTKIALPTITICERSKPFDKTINWGGPCSTPSDLHSKIFRSD